MDCFWTRSSVCTSSKVTSTNSRESSSSAVFEYFALLSASPIAAAALVVVSLLGTDRSALSCGKPFAVPLVACGANAVDADVGGVAPLGVGIGRATGVGIGDMLTMGDLGRERNPLNPLGFDGTATAEWAGTSAASITSKSSKSSI
eukprot:m.834757 g.834757  ORF g.834757 m.834757 type:complete len:146 (-) comp59469_c0_seq37:20-457(-)